MQYCLQIKSCSSLRPYCSQARTSYCFLSIFTIFTRVVTLTVSPFSFFLYSTMVLTPLASGPDTSVGGRNPTSSSSRVSPQRARDETAAIFARSRLLRLLLLLRSCQQ